MRKKRISDASQKFAELKSRADFLSGELANISEIEQDLQSALWRKIEQKASESYDEIEEKLFGFEKLSDRDLVILLARRKQIVETMAVKNYVANKDKFEAELSKVREKIRELKD